MYIYIDINVFIIDCSLSDIFTSDHIIFEFILQVCAQKYIESYSMFFVNISKHIKFNYVFSECILNIQSLFFIAYVSTSDFCLRLNICVSCSVYVRQLQSCFKHMFDVYTFEYILLEFILYWGSLQEVLSTMTWGSLHVYSREYICFMKCSEHIRHFVLNVEQNSVSKSNDSIFFFVTHRWTPWSWLDLFFSRVHVFLAKFGA